jgi:hypothetical protein
VALIAVLPWGLVHAQEDEPPVLQVSTTQAHLDAMSGVTNRPTSAGGSVAARLAGKLLSQQFKDVRVDLGPDTDTSRNNLNQQGWHFNRRAEICYENYRVGVKRGGLAMRYEMSF